MKRDYTDRCSECGALPGFICTTHLGTPLWTPCFSQVLVHDVPGPRGEIPKRHRALRSGRLR